MNPSSTLDVTTAYSERRHENGNIQTNEHLLVALSNGGVTQTAQQLKLRDENINVAPKDYDPPIDYREDVFYGPNGIRIKREASITPEEGLNALFFAAVPELFDFTSIRFYGPFQAPSLHSFFLIELSFGKNMRSTA
ncbi:unnamed protein product [Gongylonema pulchrum]|uniref:Clp R domain-containing protein n=1 Tax=Gongylonema pulchrum TaxID=637853 RepID=A0A183D5A6_9BILA|nr:unnamed protein product [Gongylonema pulchrum]